jgi:NAD(P)-dependent dehydrogenase (short-subunit alcohol dehydrogenase family)
VTGPAGPVAAVTGANRGIGRAITVAFAAAGYTVAAGARDPASLADTVATAGQVGGAAVPVGCDVSDEGSVAALADRAERLGPVHAVVASRHHRRGPQRHRRRRHVLRALFRTD